MIYIKNVRLITMEASGIVENGWLAVKDDRISAWGTMNNWPALEMTAQVVDGQGGWLLPGLIDIHSHLGMFNDGLDFEGDDGNEDTDPVTPQLRAIDGIYVDACFREAYLAGVALVMSGPGSANVFGGEFTLMRTYCSTVDQAVVLPAAAQKMALGENPKRVYGKDNKAPATRMATAALIRETLFKAREYNEKLLDYETKYHAYEVALQNGEEDAAEKPDRPDFDMQLGALIPVVRGQLPVKIHAHRQDDILTAVRICNEFGLTYTLDHCTEGYLIVDQLVQEYQAGLAAGRGSGQKGGRLLGIIVGPVIGDRSKPELAHATINNAGVLQAAGLPVAIMTDHPCVPQQYLALSAAMAVRGGMSPESALEALTITAAKIAGVDDRYGSLTLGKVADLALFSGNPLENSSRLLLFLGDGKIVYQENKEV